MWTLPRLLSPLQPLHLSHWSTNVRDGWKADAQRKTAQQLLLGVDSDPEPLLGRGEHLLKASVFADRVEVGVGFEMPNERAAGYALEIGIEHVQSRVGITQVLHQRARQIVPH